MAWLDASELRVGLGCMRLSTDEARDEEVGLATITAALDAGITVFDTAHAYGRGPDDMGHSERLLAAALRAAGDRQRARVVTKGGMRRAAGRWIADGRARTLLDDCEASLAALDGLQIDTYLVHAPDPRTPWRTTLRALAQILRDGLAARVGLSNVNRRQLDAALDLVDIAAVQVALSPFDDAALRGGVVERCAERGITLMAHSPLGGPRRARSLARERILGDVGGSLGATPAQAVLAWLLGLAPNIVAIPGATRPETARSAARAAALELPVHGRAALDRAFNISPATPDVRRPVRRDAEVLLIMGIPGAGKTAAAAEFVAAGYARLNRDERSGSLRELAAQLDAELASGVHRVVLDNTYLTRASRSRVIEAAARHRVPVRCVWLETSLARAQVNLVSRLLEHHASLPDPAELRRLARHHPGVLTPTSQMRALRELEPPAVDEGFTTIERPPVAPTDRLGHGRPGVVVAAPALEGSGWERVIAQAEPTAPHLLFDWIPDGRPEDLSGCAMRLAERVSGIVTSAICPHGGGPPQCWCRPPLPGLILAFARDQGVALSRSTLIGTRPAHRTLARSLGARYLGA